MRVAFLGGPAGRTYALVVGAVALQARWPALATGSRATLSLALPTIKRLTFIRFEACWLGRVSNGLYDCDKLSYGLISREKLIEDLARCQKHF